MVLSTRKLMVNGKAASIQDAKQKIRRYARVIERLGWSLSLSKIDVLIISAAYKVEGPLDLYRTVRYYGGRYDPELFRAAMFTKDAIHFTCFHTGSLLMTGMKGLNQLYDTYIPIFIELPLL